MRLAERMVSVDAETLERLMGEVTPLVDRP